MIKGKCVNEQLGKIREMESTRENQILILVLKITIA